MEPSMASVASDCAGPADKPAAVSLRLETLKVRADFVRASNALRQGTHGIHLQARARRPDEVAAGIRVGFTCSKKVGNAVARNRAKRRLREAARAVLPHHGRIGWDYVLVGRRDTTAALPFDTLKSDLARALDKVHRGAG
jgi:ribonuclease P protein component